MMKLYSYYRSSASYRVRIALHFKGIPFEYVPVHLTREGGQQNKADYRKINPMGHVPTLDHDGFLVAESLAIIDYLDHCSPERRLFPLEPRERAKVLQLCETINSGIQPLQNVKVTNYLEREIGQSKEEVGTWVNHWITDGLTNLEKMLEKTAGSYSFGGTVTAMDCFLIPQCFAARRFKVAIENFPLIAAVEANCLKLPAFQKAHPEKQPDFAP